MARWSRAERCWVLTKSGTKSVRSRTEQQCGGMERACCGPPVPLEAPETGMCLSPNECAAAMKVLGDQNRIRIVRALLGTERDVGDLAASTGLDVKRVSHHLAIMRLAGLVEARRNGRNVIYNVAEHVAAEWGLDFGCCCVVFRKF